MPRGTVSRAFLGYQKTLRPQEARELRAQQAAIASRLQTEMITPDERDDATAVLVGKPQLWNSWCEFMDVYGRNWYELQSKNDSSPLQLTFWCSILCCFAALLPEVEIRPGVGGDEACLWAEDTFRCSDVLLTWHSKLRKPVILKGLEGLLDWTLVPIWRFLGFTCCLAFARIWWACIRSTALRRNSVARH